VRAAAREAHGDAIVLRHHVFDCEHPIGKSGEDLHEDLAHARRPRLYVRNGDMPYVVGREELVHARDIVPVQDLGIEAPDDGLVLFGGHGSGSFRRTPSAWPGPAAQHRQHAER